MKTREHSEKIGLRKGFTLIELLVVIAIIGILAGIILPNLSSPRIKSRDAKRVSDVSQIRIALEQYADRNSGKYPVVLISLVSDEFLPALPKDPSTGADYFYSAIGTAPGCYKYHIGTNLELDGTALREDKDKAAVTACSGSVADFGGDDAAACVTGGTGYCYDMVN